MVPALVCSIVIARASATVFDVIFIFATEEIEARASPRNPRVPIFERSSAVLILLVA